MHMIIDFDSADRTTVATVGCGLARGRRQQRDGGDGEPLSESLP